MRSFFGVAALCLGLAGTGVACAFRGLEGRMGQAAASSSLAEKPGALASSYGPNNFGDIMGGCETTVLVGGSFTPMERIVLSANGNLQRVMSAYYGAPVTVIVKRCDKLDVPNKALYDREVDLVMGGQVFCTAVGRIELMDNSCVEAIESRKVGLGQLFRFLGALPHFVLLEAGRKENGELWRRYSLSCEQLKCEFTETFASNFWDFVDSPTSTGK